MKQVRLNAIFRPSAQPTVGRMCKINPDLADYPMRRTINDFEIELRFPKATYPLPSAGYFNARPFGPDESYRPGHLYPAFFSARTIFDISDDGEGSPDKELFQSAVDAMRAAATRLADSIRIIQPNVGLAGECPEMLSMEAHDTQTGEEIAVPVARKPGYGFIIDYPVL
jgi:hypothetical protein